MIGFTDKENHQGLVWTKSGFMWFLTPPDTPGDVSTFFIIRPSRSLPDMTS